MAGRGRGGGLPTVHTGNLPSRANRTYPNGTACYVWTKVGNQTVEYLYPCYSLGNDGLPPNEIRVRLVVGKLNRTVNVNNVFLTPKEAFDTVNKTGGPNLTLDTILYLHLTSNTVWFKYFLLETIRSEGQIEKPTHLHTMQQL